MSTAFTIMDMRTYLSYLSSKKQDLLLAETDDTDDQRMDTSESTETEVERRKKEQEQKNDSDDENEKRDDSD